MRDFTRREWLVANGALSVITLNPAAAAEKRAPRTPLLGFSLYGMMRDAMQLAFSEMRKG